MAAKDVLTGVLKLAEKTSGRDRICRFAARLSSPSVAPLPPPFLRLVSPLNLQVGAVWLQVCVLGDGAGGCKSRDGEEATWTGVFHQHCQET